MVRTTPGSSVSQLARSCTESKKKQAARPASSSSPLQGPCEKVMEMTEWLLPARGPGEAGAQPPTARHHGCSHHFCGCRDPLLCKAVRMGLASSDNPGELWSWALLVPSASPFEMARDAGSLQQPSSDKELVAKRGAEPTRASPAGYRMVLGSSRGWQGGCCNVIPTAFKHSSGQKLFLFTARIGQGQLAVFPEIQEFCLGPDCKVPCNALMRCGVNAAASALGTAEHQPWGALCCSPDPGRVLLPLFGRVPAARSAVPAKGAKAESFLILG